MQENFPINAGHLPLSAEGRRDLEVGKHEVIPPGVDEDEARNKETKSVI